MHYISYAKLLLSFSVCFTAAAALTVAFSADTQLNVEQFPFDQQLNFSSIWFDLCSRPKNVLEHTLKKDNRFTYSLTSRLSHVNFFFHFSQRY